jgi:hypothetical protein
MSPRPRSASNEGLIGLGILALALIFQPFQLGAVRGGLRARCLRGVSPSNLLPLCQPGTTLRSLIVASVIVALAFFVIMLISITAAYL